MYERDGHTHRQTDTHRQHRPRLYSSARQKSDLSPRSLLVEVSRHGGGLHSEHSLVLLLSHLIITTANKLSVFDACTEMLT